MQPARSRSLKKLVATEIAKNARSRPSRIADGVSVGDFQKLQGEPNPFAVKIH
jgi:hypothetical protein